ncbi:MAG: hypothetical protein AB1758_31785, partial [Candidatus Eremiobacterota bacterium]
MRVRGMALITVLLAATVLSIMLSAFLQVNRSQLSLAGGVRSLRKANLAAQSGLKFAWMRLEAQPSWGIATAPNASVQLSVDTEAFRVFEGVDNFTHVAVGIIDGGEAHFQIYVQSPKMPQAYDRYLDDSIRNNPLDPASWILFADADRRLLSYQYIPADPNWEGPIPCPGGSLRTAFPESANLVVTGYCQGHRVTLDTTLKRAELVEGSMIADGDITVMLDGGASTTGTWTIDSSDRNLNTIRSNRRIFAPPARTSPRRTVLFGNGSSDNAGTAISSGNIILGATGLINDSAGNVTGFWGGTELGDGRNDASEMAAAASASKGTFSPNNGRYEIPRLKESDIASPSFPRDTRIPPGHYHFVDANTV